MLRRAVMAHEEGFGSFYAGSATGYARRMATFFERRISKLTNSVGLEDLQQIAMVAIYQACRDYLWLCADCDHRASTGQLHEQHCVEVHGEARPPRRDLMTYVHGICGRALDHETRRYVRRAKWPTTSLSVEMSLEESRQVQQVLVAGYEPLELLVDLKREVERASESGHEAKRLETILETKQRKRRGARAPRELPKQVALVPEPKQEQIAPPKKEESMTKTNVISLIKKDERRKAEKDKLAAASRSIEVKQTNRIAAIEDAIDVLVADLSTTEWKIGAHLKEIYDEDLWRLRGEATFESYVNVRFGFSAQTAKSYMKISEVFTEKDAEELQVSQMALLVKVPEGKEREKLIEQVRRDNPTVAELAKVVKTKRAEAGLHTARSGHEGTVMVSERLKVGIVAEVAWKSGAPVTPDAKGISRYALVRIGDATFRIEDHGDKGLTMILLDPEAG